MPITYFMYSCTETMKIMLSARAINNNFINVLDITDKSSVPVSPKQIQTDPDTLISAHNSYFNLAILIPGIMTTFYYPGPDTVATWKYINACLYVITQMRIICRLFHQWLNQLFKFSIFLFRSTFP